MIFLHTLYTCARTMLLIGLLCGHHNSMRAMDAANNSSSKNNSSLKDDALKAFVISVATVAGATLLTGAGAILVKYFDLFGEKEEARKIRAEARESECIFKERQLDQNDEKIRNETLKICSENYNTIMNINPDDHQTISSIVECIRYNSAPRSKNYITISAPQKFS